jgi:dTMP kinase
VFITFEGVEGSGKTTQIGFLSQYLFKKGIPFVVTREPGGSPIGSELRKLLLSEESKINRTTELLLYLAERSEHIEKVILPAIESGKIVLCDRFSDATRAYQIYGRKLEREEVENLIYFATNGLEPDLTLLLRLDPERALSRARRRDKANLFSEGKFESYDLDFHRRVYEGYELLAKEYQRIKVIDATGEKGDVFQEILKALIIAGVICEA